MTLSERTLEEDEAKIDNILHKVLESDKKIKQLVKFVESKSQDEDLLEAAKQIEIITDIIENLIMLCDEIVIADEEITKELEKKIKDELALAIDKIKDASELLGKHKNQGQ